MDIRLSPGKAIRFSEEVLKPPATDTVKAVLDMRSRGYPDFGRNKPCCHTQDAVLIFEKCQLYRRTDSLESYSMEIVESLSLSTLLKLALICWNLCAGELHAFLQFPHDEKAWKNLHGQYQYYSDEQVSYGDFIRSFDFLLSSNLPVPGQDSRSEPAIRQNNQMPISRTYSNRNFGPGISLRRMQVISSTTDPVSSFAGRLDTHRTTPNHYLHYSSPYLRQVHRRSICHEREKPRGHRTATGHFFAVKLFHDETIRALTNPSN